MAETEAMQSQSEEDLNACMHCDIVSGFTKGDVQGQYTKTSVSVTCPKCWKNSLPEHCEEA